MVRSSSSRIPHLLRCMGVSLRKRIWQPLLLGTVLAIYLAVMGLNVRANLLCTLLGIVICAAFICVRSYRRHRWD